MDLSARFEEGNRYHMVGDFDQGIRIFEQALQEGSSQTGDKWMIYIMIRLCDCYNSTGKQKEALKMARKAVALAESEHGKGKVYLDALQNLIHKETRCGKLKDALKHSEEHLELSKSLFGTDCEEYGQSLVIKAEPLYHLKVRDRSWLLILLKKFYSLEIRGSSGAPSRSTRDSAKDQGWPIWKVSPSIICESHEAGTICRGPSRANGSSARCQRNISS